MSFSLLISVRTPAISFLIPSSCWLMSPILSSMVRCSGGVMGDSIIAHSHQFLQGVIDRKIFTLYEPYHLPSKPKEDGDERGVGSYD